MSYNSSFLNVHQTSSLTPTSTSKTIHLTSIQNAATFVGTPVLNSNRILSPLGCLNVFIRSIRPPNHPIGTLYWPQIIVLAWICSSELQIHDLIWRKKNSFQLGSKAQIRYLSGGSDIWWTRQAHWNRSKLGLNRARCLLHIWRLFEWQLGLCIGFWSWSWRSIPIT
jgi:hypothetical protein